jgi:hypothetical protein
LILGSSADDKILAIDKRFKNAFWTSPFIFNNVSGDFLYYTQNRPNSFVYLDGNVEQDVYYVDGVKSNYKFSNYTGHVCEGRPFWIAVGQNGYIPPK